MQCLLGPPPQRHHLHHAAAGIWQMQRQQVGRDRSVGANLQTVSSWMQRSGGDRTWACSLVPRHHARTGCAGGRLAEEDGGIAPAHP